MGVRIGPWIWGLGADLLVFAGSACVALGLVALAPLLAPGDGALPAWGFLLFVVAIDVAHVHSTLFRTYLDREELRRRPVLYAGVPLGCLAVGLLLHAHSSALFWRVLAYVALTHFIRQQVGWVAIYRARAGGATRLSRVLDDAAVYAATLYPVLYWHTTPRAFAWFVPGDFVELELGAVMPVAAGLYAFILFAYVAVSIQKSLQTKRVELGKHVVVLSTAVTWYVGIVLTSSDFAFTVANVIVHGVPYMMLLWVYAQKRARSGADGIAMIRLVTRYGVAAFVVMLGAIAFAEEMLWDQLVWHSHPTLFGDSSHRELPELLLAFLVPLLVVPQATHYVLDAVLWRRRDTSETQGRALGFTGAPAEAATASSPARR